ncbi:MAG TPA: FHA domain-containing protein [Planctomycetaceae bacterium]|nr:FHA domain-containing protein [Planctomycetaceae bacterium]
MRPLPTGRDGEKFLIGGDDDCDLQLGGDEMPALHSLLYFDGDELRIETVALEPPLLVNQQAVRSCLLHNGDCLEIGPFELAVRWDQHQRRSDVALGPKSLSTEPPGDHEIEFDPEKLDDLSADELVDALDREMQMIERFERRQKLGADALLDAVLMRREQPSETLNGPVEDFARSAPRPTADYDLLLDLDRAIEQLNGTIQHLEQRSQNLERRESAYLEAAATLLEVQERVAAQLEAVERQLADLRDTNNRSRRASA